MNVGQVPCPRCGSRKFSAIPGSECHCSCGTAFRITWKPDSEFRTEILNQEFDHLREPRKAMDRSREFGRSE